jgi:hypothetical protein
MRSVQSYSAFSFLKRERERTVTAFHYSFQRATALRLESSGVFNRSPLLTVTMTVPETVRNGCRTFAVSVNVFIKCNDNATVTLSLQKRKNS